ncbi:hypothetical protein ACJRO7_032918 [Eucalyptus globulus]|uniref:Uncharacterized protein n=1 Tax=Eucalyptus globulus TaxID=34317 RepID=A0ABD3JL50_EUCGL
MLSDCHRYGMNTANCRARSLIEYFGEHFSHEKCVHCSSFSALFVEYALMNYGLLSSYIMLKIRCDVCIKGPPEMLDVREEADIFMQVLAAHKKQYALSWGNSGYIADSYDDDITRRDVKQRQNVEKLYLKLLVNKIREQSPKYMAIDMLWWQGHARVMESKGYIKEGDEKANVQIKYPELTERGWDFVQSQREESLYIFPEADMLLSGRKRRSFSTFSEWGKGCADPEIRRQRLERRRSNRRPIRERKSKGFKASQKTVRGRLVKLLKLKSRERGVKNHFLNNTEKQTASLHLVSALLAMEPTDCVTSHSRWWVREDGCSPERLIWDHCICKVKLILEIKSNCDDVLDELYELHTEFMTSSRDDNTIKGNVRALKYTSSLFPDDASHEDVMVRKMVVPLHCSLNMLEGDAGWFIVSCSVWIYELTEISFKSILFLSEFILSLPDMLSSKTCFEVGSGVGLVGICLCHVKASKVILSDGDLSTLGNMKLNLKMNQMSTEDDEPVTSECVDSFDHMQIGGIRTEINIISSPQVKCLHLPWECASESVLQGLKPDIILGADVIYGPFCPPHLSIGSSNDYSDGCDSHDVVAACDSASNAGPTEHLMAYISFVIRNANTFNRFLALVNEANLAITDPTGTLQPASLLPYMQSYDRSSI